MEATNYQRPRYYPAHHFVFYPVMGAAGAGCLYFAFKYPHDLWLWLFLGFAFAALIALSLMMRQHYALGNQDRIVRLEMRLRYYILTGKRLEPIEEQLSFKHIAVLRFASDEELPGLIHRAIDEKMSPGRIKHTIKNWVRDDMRL